MENNSKSLHLQNQKLTRLWIAFFLANIIALIYSSSFAEHAFPTFIFSIFIGCSFALIIYFVSSVISPIKDKATEGNSFFPIQEKDNVIKIIIDNEKLPRTQIRFTSETEISSQVVPGENMVIFTNDYRSIRLNKSEIKNFYTALIESEYSYFKPGNHEIEIKITKK